MAPRMESETGKGASMTIQPVSNNTQALGMAKIKAPQANDKRAAAAGQPQAPAKPASQQVDTVQISSAAKQALQEATETQAQTKKEATGGDLQAKKLLAKEMAAQAAQQPTQNSGVEKLIK